MTQKEISGLSLVGEQEEDKEYSFDGYNGGFNTVVVKNNKAYIKEADCPDRLCVIPFVQRRYKSQSLNGNVRMSGSISVLSALIPRACDKTGPSFLFSL